MNLQEQYNRLFKGRVATTDKKILSEGKFKNAWGNPEQFPKKWITKIKANPTLKQMGMKSVKLTKEKQTLKFYAYDAIIIKFPDDKIIKGPASKMAEWEEILAKMGMKKDRDYDTMYWPGADRIHPIHGQVEIHFNNHDTDDTDSSGSDSENVIVTDGSVDGRNREANGTYTGDEWELETEDGMTTIWVKGQLIDDDDPKYDEILTAVNDYGFSLEEELGAA